MSKHYLPFKKGTKLTVTQGDRQTNHSNLGYVAYDFWTNGDRTVLSIVKGTIVHLGTGWNSGWGNSITIKADDGTFYRYAHLRDNPFSKHTIGKTVTIGTDLGIMGNTGKVSGPTGIHLHLEKLRYFNTSTGKGSGGMKIDFFEDGYLEKNEIVYSQNPGLIIQPPVTDNNTIKIGDYYVTMNNFFDPVADIAHHNGKEIIFRQSDGQVKAFLTNEKGFAFWYHHVGWADNRIKLVGGADIRVGGREELLFDLYDGTVATFLNDDNGLAYKYQVVGKRNPNYKLIDAGNFDNDQLKELLFDEGNGRMGIFDMNIDGIAINYRYLGSYGTNEYKVLGAGDINGDGRDEILFGGIWGNIGAFSMNDNALATNFSKRGWGYTGQHVVGIGNIDADIQDELLTRDPKSGDIYSYHFNSNGMQEAYKWVAWVKPSILSQGLGDITGDGRAEILFRVSNGEVSYLTMNASGVATQYLVSGWADSSIPIM